MNQTNHRSHHLYTIRNDELGRQDEAVVAIKSISSHLISVGDANVVITECVIDAGARGCVY